MVVLLDSRAVTETETGGCWGRVTRGDPLCASHALIPCAWYPFVILIASMRDSGMRGDAAAPIDNDGTRTQPRNGGLMVLAKSFHAEQNGLLVL